MNDQRAAAWCGVQILDAVDSDAAWIVFWSAVELARAEHNKKLAGGADDDLRG